MSGAVVAPRVTPATARPSRGITTRGIAEGPGSGNAKRPRRLATEATIRLWPVPEGRRVSSCDRAPRGAGPRAGPGRGVGRAGGGAGPGAGWAEGLGARAGVGRGHDLGPARFGLMGVLL